MSFRKISKVFNKAEYKELGSHLQVLKFSSETNIRSYIQEKNFNQDYLIFMIKSLKKSQMTKKACILFNYLPTYSYHNIADYINLIELLRNSEATEVYSESIYDIVNNHSSALKTYQIANIIRNLENLELNTAKKYKIIESLYELVEKNLEMFSEIDLAFITQGIMKFPCDQVYEIFGKIAEMKKKKTIFELASLCNFLSFNRIEKFEYLFTEFEERILMDEKINTVLTMAVHSFCKSKLGSYRLFWRFLEEFDLNRKSLDSASVGVIMVSFFRYVNIDFEMYERVKKIYDEENQRMLVKHLKSIEWIIQNDEMISGLERMIVKPGK